MMFLKEKVLIYTVAYLTKLCQILVIRQETSKNNMFFFRASTNLCSWYILKREIQKLN